MAELAGHARFAAPLARNASSALLLDTATSLTGRKARFGNPVGGSVACTCVTPTGHTADWPSADTAAQGCRCARLRPEAGARSGVCGCAAQRRAESRAAAAAAAAARVAPVAPLQQGTGDMFRSGQHVAATARAAHGRDGSRSASGFYCGSDTSSAGVFCSTRSIVIGIPALMPQSPPPPPQLAVPFRERQAQFSGSPPELQPGPPHPGPDTRPSMRQWPPKRRLRANVPPCE